MFLIDFDAIQEQCNEKRQKAGTSAPDQNKGHLIEMLLNNLVTKKT